MDILKYWIFFKISLNNGYFLGHNEDNFFLKFLPELSLTYAVNFFKGRFIVKKASYMCTSVSRLRTKFVYYIFIFS